MEGVSATPPPNKLRKLWCLCDWGGEWWGWRSSVFLIYVTEDADQRISPLPTKNHFLSTKMNSIIVFSWYKFRKTQQDPQILHESYDIQWRIQDFPEECANSQSVIILQTFCRKLHENMEMKEFGPRGVSPWSPHWICQWIYIVKFWTHAPSSTSV